MKRSEMLEHLSNLLEGNGVELQMSDVHDILAGLEEAGMFYCPVEDCGSFKLRVPKGWKEE